MATLGDVFKELNALKAQGIVADYALGATAMLFYAEPARTYDLDVFVMPSVKGSGLVSLGPVYDCASAGLSREVRTHPDLSGASTVPPSA